MARANPAADYQRRMGAMRSTLAARTSANSTTLSQSFGLPVDDVRRTLRAMGVKDDG